MQRGTVRDGVSFNIKKTIGSECSRMEGEVVKIDFGANGIEKLALTV